MNPFRFLPIALLAFAPLGSAAVPSLLNYQGRISVAGQPYDGSGQFKFAFVNGAGTILWLSSPDTAPADGVPDQVIALPVSKGNYSILLGDPAVPGMAAIPPALFQATDLRLRVWFNDGSHGQQQLAPDQRVASEAFSFIAGTVPDGAITSAKIAPGAVGTSQLADGAVSSDKIAAGSVDGSRLATGSVGVSQLAAGAASANLAAAGQSAVGIGGVLMSENPYDPAMAAAGYVKIGSTTTNDSWDRRDLSSVPLGTLRYSHSAVWTGTEMIIWGGQYIMATGWRYNPAANTWTATDITRAPSARSEHTAVWTGTEMIVWGGWNGSNQVGTGARYNPSTNTWAEMADAGAVTMQRSGHTAVWTGSEMLIWGGYTGSSQVTNLGGRYDPTGGPTGTTGAPVGTWRQIPNTGAPTARTEHSAVWTGSEMIIWGGISYSPFIYLGDGARYNPSTGPLDPGSGLPVGTWTPVSMTDAPLARHLHTAVWTGSEMIVWGGLDLSFNGDSNSGGRYAPATDSWVATTLSGAPDGRRNHTAIWTGTEMLVWGGQKENQNAFGDGGRYNPSAGPGGTWSAIPATPAFAGRFYHSAVWTGGEMIVWGGFSGQSGLSVDGGRYQAATGNWTVFSTPLAGRIDHCTVWTGSEMIVWGGGGLGGPAYGDGGRYNPALDAWQRISTTNAPSARRLATAVWTGSEMIVWGGWDGSVYFNDGKRYQPATNTWANVATAGAPSARRKHTAVWTGSQMIVWGGSLGSTYLDSGARYNPTANQWTAVANDGVPPSARDVHVAVWTGSEMIVWGGYNGVQLGDGARYDPADNSWTPCTTASAPFARESPTAVWTGSEMIVWGGYNSVDPYTNSGARYRPVGGGSDPNTGKPLGVWTPMTNTGRPYQRMAHSAVWTGRYMVIWGGGGLTSSDNALYDPAADIWSPVTTEGAAPFRGGHSGVWTGSTMLIWGGYNSSSTYSDTYGYNPPRKLYLYQKP